MGTTIAISNQKGGVAKTTTCLSLGACLAELERKVLLIDLDPQAHLTLSLRIISKKPSRTVGDALMSNASVASLSCKSSTLGLDVVPADQDLALVDKLLYGYKGYEFRLKDKLEAMNKNYYDFVLLDCPPNFGTLTLNALTAANLLLIPTPCEYYTAQSLRKIIELARLVRQKTNPQLVYQILVTMYDQRNRICRLILEQMRRDLNQVLYQTAIEVDTKLKECPAFGQPITLYAPNSRSAKQYRALAKELTHHGQ